MIKIETIGMIDVAKNNPVIVSETDVKNNSFITYEGNLYVVMNTIVGDDAYKDEAVIKAGEYLNGFLVEAWKGQKLVVDAKHVTGGIASLAKDATLIVDTTTGGLKTGTASSGVYFKVKDLDAMLTEKAIKVEVCVA